MSASAMANRIESAADYFKAVGHLLRDEDWETTEQAAQLLSVNGPHAQKGFLHLNNFYSRRERPYIQDEELDQIVCLHLQVLYHCYSSNDMEQAYLAHTQLMSVFNKEVLQKRKEENWFMPMFFVFCTDLRAVAKMADMQASRGEEEGAAAASRYEQCASHIMESYRTCVSDIRADPSTTKKIAMLNMTNQLFRIYFKINKLNLLKPLIRAIDNMDKAGPLYGSFSMADKVTYNYFLGRKAMFDSDLALAERSLSYAFRNCPSSAARNKQLILVYLVPVKMFLGHMPSRQLMEKYKLESFIEVVEAVKQGNLARLDAALSKHEHFFIQCGIFLMLEKLRAIASRTLFKKVALLIGGNQIPLSAFSVALRHLGVEEMDDDELECIVANLIAEKKIKGYISHQHQMLVVSKKDPFPALSTIA